MRPRTAPAPAWRRVLAAFWRATKLTLRVLFMLSLAALPIPIAALPFYRPHRERRNHAAQVLKEE